MCQTNGDPSNQPNNDQNPRHDPMQEQKQEQEENHAMMVDAVAMSARDKRSQPHGHYQQEKKEESDLELFERILGTLRRRHAEVPLFHDFARLDDCHQIVTRTDMGSGGAGQKIPGGSYPCQHLDTAHGSVNACDFSSCQAPANARLLSTLPPALTLPRGPIQLRRLSYRVFQRGPTSLSSDEAASVPSPGFEAVLDAQRDSVANAMLALYASDPAKNDGDDIMDGGLEFISGSHHRRRDTMPESSVETGDANSDSNRNGSRGRSNENGAKRDVEVDLDAGDWHTIPLDL